MESLPSILFKVIQGAFDEMGDHQFLAIKTFDGKLRRQGLTNPTCAEGFKSAAGDLASVTALAGKDLYLASAKAVFYLNVPVNGVTHAEVVLKINGNIVETAKVSFQGDNTTANGKGSGGIPYEFKNMDHMVAPTQIIKLEVISIPAWIDVEGFVECWEEDTGTSPQIPPLNPV